MQSSKELAEKYIDRANSSTSSHKRLGIDRDSSDAEIT